MNHQVLARKWRPQTFAEVIGQKYVLTALTNSLSLRRIHHAWLFSGTRGIGKTSIARLLVKGLNCENGITATPCNACDNCREIKHGCFVDLIEIDAASRTKVEDTRDLLDNVQYSPVRGRFKAYLIDEAHMLSRHSFNALLKVLEEPPMHVKFLLATTDPQKLPVTILSRCLQFHLKMLDIEQICHQLKYILNKEQISYDARALQLLANAAEGSMRDALSLTDQAIIVSNGRLTAESVSNMLGILDDDQALSLIEAVVVADGERMMKLINDAASRGVEWEALLIEMLSFLHRIAMAQLLPVVHSSNASIVEQRIYELARTVSPTDVQLYYQTILIGRKDLPLAPNRRMGVEMTLLRALAFHPKNPLPEPKTVLQSFILNSSTKEEVIPKLQPSQQIISPTKTMTLLEDSNQVFTANKQILHAQKVTRYKENKSSVELDNIRLINKTELKCSMLTTENVQKQVVVPKQKVHFDKKLINGNKLALLQYKKKSMLELKLAKEVIDRDSWAAEIVKLKLPKLVEQIALNTWKEQSGSQIRLHLRSKKYCFNLLEVQKILSKAFNILYGTPVELTIVEDNSSSVLTPLEWQKIIYEEKLIQARKLITADNHVQTIQYFFDAELDEESIYPI